MTPPTHLRLIVAATATLLSALALDPSQRFARFNAKHSRRAASTPLQQAQAAAATPTTANCSEHFFTQSIDHFSWSAPPTGQFTYQQRYFLNDQFWKKDASGCILFYAGNEAPVDLYVNHTGLWWEAAAELNALIVFAEHRYFGKSQPFGDASGQYLYAMTHEQALADYAVLIRDLQSNLTGGVTQPVIVGGGSYGGMLAAWARMKYPASFAGAIAASAPILAFVENTPAYDSQVCGEGGPGSAISAWNGLLAHGDASGPGPSEYPVGTPIDQKLLFCCLLSCCPTTPYHSLSLAATPRTPDTRPPTLSLPRITRAPRSPTGPW